jgi:predicted transcriptional regulator
MSQALSQVSRRLRRKLTLARFVDRAARQAALVLIVGACVALLGRAVFDLELRHAALFLLPVVLVPWTAWRSIKGSLPSEEQAATWLDLHSGAQGFLLVDYELEDARWNARTKRQLDGLSELPPFDFAPLYRFVLPALAFCAFTLFVPPERSDPGPSTSLFDRAIAGLSDRLETLNEVVELDEVVADELASRIDELAENIDAAEPEAMLEAIDSLRQQLGVEGQDAAELARELSERFGEAGARALADSDAAQQLMSAALEKMADSGFRAEMLKQLQELAPELAAGLEGNQLKLPDGFELTPEQLRALSEGMREALKDNLSKLSLAGLVDLKELKLSDELASLSKLVGELHVCDENCEPGGT